ncbi:MAG TPA: DNA replication and repair protein RecF [Polyangiaceae bacterium]|nr:DNA replication and repair protein RecF [Polyangiaceae bacterium]
MTDSSGFASVRFQKLSIRSLRNIALIEIEPAPGLNVIVGDNGQGKTSLLEAIYLVATTRSFRSERLVTLLRMGDERALVRATIQEDGYAREQRVTLSKKGRSVELDGKRPVALSAYATRTPVVVFHPADLELVSGAEAGRRRLLDRLVLFLDPPGAEARARYGLALQSRQRVLEERGATARELTAFEAVMAEAGARLCRARRVVAEALGSALADSFSRIAASQLRLRVHYRAGGSEDAEAFRLALFERRIMDTRRRRATFGPQRDELELELEGRPARHHASQGQQRLLALSLKLSELECIRLARRAQPVLLLDDVSSELDPSRTGAVYDFVQGSASQIFVTTTRPELFAPGARASDQALWRLLAGAICRPDET